MALRSAPSSASRCPGWNRSSDPLPSITAPAASRISSGSAARQRVTWRRPRSIAGARLAVTVKYLARVVATNVAAHGDAATLELADPVGGQRAFVEGREFFDVFGASAY